MIRCLLALTDGSEPATAAVETAIDLARSIGPEARLHVAAVIDYVEIPGMLSKPPPGAPDLLTVQAHNALEAAKSAAAAAGVAIEAHLLKGDVVDSILACAGEIGADMLVAGVTARSKLARFVLGSVVADLVRATDLPVTVVRRPIGVDEKDG
jgi:nucleotide-binding universal stress UspA family protein